MKDIDYFKIIHKYIKPGSLLYTIYLPHVFLVTNKALKIARHIKLSNEQIRFIEEAGMLHDIGIVNVNAPEIGCFGKYDYFCHITEGRKILDKEGLPNHARIAENHVGVGLTKEQILEQHMPVEPKDMLAETIEEKIISYADLFYSKNPKKLWVEKSIEEIINEMKSWNFQFQEKLKIFDEWRNLFEN